MKAYLGADVSKGYADFTLLDCDKNQLEEVFQLDDTRSGHDCLKEQLESLIKKHSITHFKCSLESTSGVANNWYGSISFWSKVMPVSVARLTPAGVKESIEAGLNRTVPVTLSSRYTAESLV